MAAFIERFKKIGEHYQHSSFPKIDKKSLRKILSDMGPDDFEEKIILNFSIEDRLQITRVVIGPHGSNYGIRPISINARTIGMRENIKLIRELDTFGISPGIPIGELESKFILSKEKFDELHLDLNELYSGVKNCTIETSHYLDVKLIPKVAGKTGYVADEPGRDYHSMPFDMQLTKLGKLEKKDVLDDKTAFAQFRSWGNPEMHGDSSDILINLFINSSTYRELEKASDKYKYKLSLNVEKKAQETPLRRIENLSKKFV